MPNSILKYDLTFPGSTTLCLPVSNDGSVSILSAEVQGEGIVLYVTTDLDATTCEHRQIQFFCAETGTDTLPDPDPYHTWVRINTCMLGDGGTYVIHVFTQDSIL